MTAGAGGWSAEVLALGCCVTRWGSKASATAPEKPRLRTVRHTFFDSRVSLIELAIEDRLRLLAATFALAVPAGEAAFSPALSATAASADAPEADGVGGSGRSLFRGVLSSDVLVRCVVGGGGMLPSAAAEDALRGLPLSLSLLS